MARGAPADPRKALLRQLRMLVWPEGQAERKGLVYRGPADFVLRHGEWFEPRPLPAGYPSGAPGKCYGNAIVVAAAHGLEYVEGWALDPGRLGAAFHHAWNADDEGLVDSTWAARVGTVRVMYVGGEAVSVVGTPGAAYLGVRFSVERADDCTWNGDASVLDDWQRGWPLLREPWEGEPAEFEWPPSSRLELIRARDLRAAPRPTAWLRGGVG